MKMVSITTKETNVSACNDIPGAAFVKMFEKVSYMECEMYVWAHILICIYVIAYFGDKQIK